LQPGAEFFEDEAILRDAFVRCQGRPVRLLRRNKRNGPSLRVQDKIACGIALKRR
jgi:hypothetical protein